MNTNWHKYDRNSKRTSAIAQKKIRKGKGYILTPRYRDALWDKVYDYQRPLTLSHKFRRNEGHDYYSESYTRTLRIRIPYSLKHLKGHELGAYLADAGVIDTSFCQHSYDCCGCYYPDTNGDIIFRSGRELVIRQSFSQNV